MINKKIVLILTLFLMFIVTIGTISATNNTDNNDITTQQIKETPNNQQQTITTQNTNNTKTINKATTQKTTKQATTEVNNYEGLLSAINTAKTSTDEEYTINLNEGEYKITNPISWSGSQTTKKLTINGNGNTIDGQNNKNFIEVSEGHTLILNKLTVSNCYKNGDGGAIKNKGTLIINNSSFNNNQANYAGVILNEGTLTISDSTFEKNSVEETGGVIRNYENMNINNSKFIQNKAKNGGCIASDVRYDYEINITNCEFDQNSVNSIGSALLISDEDLEGPDRINVHVINSSFTNNSAFRGTIFIGELTADFENCTFENNKAKVRGGVIFNYFSIFTMKNSKFINNTENEPDDSDNCGGGAIYQYSDYESSTIQNCTFINNSAVGNQGGGSIYDLGDELHIYNSTFINTTPTDFVLIKSENEYNIKQNDTGKHIPSNASIEIYLDQKKLENTELIDGEITNLILPKGNHELKLVVTNESEKFLQNTYVLDYSELPIYTTTNLTIINNTVGNTKVNVSVADEFDDPISNGMISVMDEEGNMIGLGYINKNNESIISLDLPAGEHLITAIYQGNITHASSNNTTTIRVLHKTNIKIDVLNETEGNVTAIISVTDENNQPIKDEDINITLPDGTKITKKTDANGSITIKDSQLTPGETSIYANKTANDKYTSAEASEIINVVPDYQQIIDNMNNTIQDQNKTIQDQNKTIQDQNKTIQDQNKTIQDLNETVQEQKQTIDNLEDTVDKLNNTIKDLNDTVEEQKQTIDNLQDKISALNEKIDNLTKEINDKNKTIEDLNKDIKELNDEINALQDEIDELAKKLEELNKTSIIRAVPENGTVDDNKVVVTLDNRIGTHVANAPITIKNSAGEIIGNGTTDDEGVAVIPVKTKAGTENITISYPGNSKYSNASKTVSITTSKNNVSVTVDSVEGVIGEDIRLIAHVLDVNGNPVSGGNLVFKLNGKTLRSDGRFDSNASALKFKVENGTVRVTIKADLYLRNAKNLTASYSGSYKYNEAKSSTVTAQIKKRNAQISVSASPKSQKQYNTITFTAKLKDVTPNHANKTAVNTGTKVLFKINGKTIKDSKGNNVLVKVNNGTATYKYTVPAGMGGITKDGQTRDYSVEALLVSDTFYPDTRSTTTFNVQRSPITINIKQVSANSKNMLNVKADIVDYKNKYVIGNNTVALKINGKTYINPKTNKTAYFTANNGKIDLKNVQVSKDITIKKVMIVTGARQAYLGQRNETSSIVKV